MSPLPDDEPPYTPDPAQKLAVLRALAQQMETLMPRVAARGARVPTRVGPQALRYFDLVDAIIQQTIDSGEPKDAVVNAS